MGWRCQSDLLCADAVLAKRIVRQGADALVIEGAEAGGHIGPVSSILAQEILPFIKEIPIFIAGGIGRGDTVLAYLELSAAGCNLAHFSAKR